MYFRPKCFRLFQPFRKRRLTRKIGYFEQIWGGIVVRTDSTPAFLETWSIWIKSSSLFLDYDMKLFWSPAEFSLSHQFWSCSDFFSVVEAFFLTLCFAYMSLLFVFVVTITKLWNPLPSSTTSVSSTCWDPFFGHGLGGFWKMCVNDRELFDC